MTQGTRARFCPHCGVQDVDHSGMAHIEAGEYNGKEYETDGDVDAFQCHGCGAEFYVWGDAAAATRSWDDRLSLIEAGLREAGLQYTADHIKTARQELEIEVEDEPVRVRASIDAAQIQEVLDGNHVTCPKCGGGNLTRNEVGGMLYIEHHSPSCDFVQDAGRAS
jgi:predicted RNA-binding Zn-ribbon protein involved in translation (DUF1610 family)